MSSIGQSLKRKEDPRLLTGRGTFADNLKLPGMLHAVIVRSPLAHARIRSVDVSAASAIPGVIAVLSGADLPGRAIRGAWLVPDTDTKCPPHPWLAWDTVRYVGDSVAVVVAETRAIAEDAAELVEVDYEPLPVVVSARRAIEAGAPQLHEVAPGNRGIVHHIREGDIDAAFRDAEVVVDLPHVNQRLIPGSMEGRVVVARWEGFVEEMTVWIGSQNPHAHREGMARALGIPEHKLRVIAPDVGGGFGAKAPVYTEDLLIPYLARLLDRPVKWVQTRRDDCAATIHARDNDTEIELAAKRDGTLLGIRGRTYANLGAYLSGAGAGIPTVVYTALLPGAYRLPAIEYDVIGAFTNTTPTDAYRGAGAAMATYAIERLMDLLAREIGMDPAELRRKNFVQSHEFPYSQITGLAYDSGDYQAALDAALKALDYGAFREEQRLAREQGRYLGLGISSFIECTGFGPSRMLQSPSGKYLAQTGGRAGYEMAHVKVAPTGKVIVAIGTSPHGQGGFTTCAQIVADSLGVGIDDIEVVAGDTATTPHGWGTFASRAAVTTGNAVFSASQRLGEKARRIAAHLLEAAPEDIELADGLYGVRGSPGKSVTFATIAATAHSNQLPPGIDHGLDETTPFDPNNYAFPFGTHLCAVEVDPETGDIAILRYIAVDDCGVQINPLIVEGQLHGGIVQGLGQALWEGVIYDGEGQLVTGSLMDYGLPKIEMVPALELDHTTTPAPDNPLGVKGVGEAGTIAATPAVVNAVVDALAPLGVRDIAMPLTRERVWQAMRAATG